jgi:hypothetical protein
MDELRMFSFLRPRQQPVDVSGARDRLTTAIAETSRPRRVPRAARRYAIAGGLATVAAGAALVVPAVLPRGGGTFTGTAWAVDRQSNGTVTVTVEEEFHDPAGLQRALRADGIKAYVRWVSLVVTQRDGQEVVSQTCSYNVGKYAMNIRGAIAERLYSDATVPFGRWSWVIKPSVIPANSSLFLLTLGSRRKLVSPPRSVGIVAVGEPTILSIPYLPACVPTHP